MYLPSTGLVSGLLRLRKGNTGNSGTVVAFVVLLLVVIVAVSTRTRH